LSIPLRFLSVLTPSRSSRIQTPFFSRMISTRVAQTTIMTEWREARAPISVWHEKLLGLSFLILFHTGLAFVGQLTAVVIAIVLHYGGYGLFEGNIRGVPLDVQFTDNPASKSHAWHAVVGDSSNNWMASSMPLQDERTISAIPIELIYDAGDNCLTAKNLASMKQLEADLFSLPAYNNTICQLNSNGVCIEATSIQRFFDGTYEYLNVMVGGQNVFRPDAAFERITEIVRAAYALNGGADGSETNLRIILDYVLSAGLLVCLILIPPSIIFCDNIQRLCSHLAHDIRHPAQLRHCVDLPLQVLLWPAPGRVLQHEGAQGGAGGASRGAPG
jgi:hypothetical protein